jgi:alginate O-acetyltransferase complex protein AlgI
VQRNFYKLALYISIFPALIAGPIIKYHDLKDQIDNHKVTFDKFVYEVKRFIIGLSKKCLLQILLEKWQTKFL